MIIYAGLDALKRKITPPEAADTNLFKANANILSQFAKLPSTLDEAISLMKKSAFIQAHIPAAIIALYAKQQLKK